LFSASRRNWDGGRYDEMHQLLAGDHGNELSRRRQPIHLVFAQMKFNRGLDGFRRRGGAAVPTNGDSSPPPTTSSSSTRRTLAAA